MRIQLFKAWYGLFVCHLHKHKKFTELLQMKGKLFYIIEEQRRQEKKTDIKISVWAYLV